MTIPTNENEVARLLDFTVPPPAATEIAALRARLAEDAEDAGLLDVAFRTFDSPVGTLLLAATPAGLVRVAFQRENFAKVLETLAAKLSPRIVAATRRLDPAARQLDEYFARQRRCFDVPLDLRLAAGFRRQVLAYLSEIEYGNTVSYAAVAAAVENPRAVRAVGTACATNPIPLIIPCHRVVRSDGQTGNYAGGPDVKRWLLQLELDV